MGICERSPKSELLGTEKRVCTCTACECVSVCLYIVYAVYVVGYWRSEREDCGNWLNLLDSGKAGCNGRRAYALAEMRILCCMYGGV